MNEKTKSNLAIIILIIAVLSTAGVIVYLSLFLVGMTHSLYGLRGLLWLAGALVLGAVVVYAAMKIVIWAMDTVEIDD